MGLLNNAFSRQRPTQQTKTTMMMKIRTTMMTTTPTMTMTKKAGYTATEVACGWAEAVMKIANPSICPLVRGSKDKNHQ